MKNKVKSRQIVRKRFKVTGTGKILRRSPEMRHLRRRKSAKQIRRYRHYIEVTGKFARKIRTMLGI